MDKLANFRKKIEEETVKNIKILQLVDLMNIEYNNVILQIFTSSKNSGDFFSLLYNKISSNYRLQCIFDLIKTDRYTGKEEFIEIYKSLLKPEVEAALFPKPPITEEAKLKRSKSIRLFTRNLSYSLRLKILKNIFNSIKQIGIDENKFNVSFMDLLVDYERYKPFESLMERSSYIVDTLDKIRNNGKINIYFMIGATKSMSSIHSNILIFFNGKHYSIDTVPALNYIPNLLEEQNEKCLCNNMTFRSNNSQIERYAVLQDDITSCVKKSLTLITYLVDILSVVNLKYNKDVIDKLLSNRLIEYGIAQTLNTDSVLIDNHSQIFFSAPLYAIPASDFLYLKKRALSYLLRERQYLQVLSDSNHIFSEETKVDGDSVIDSQYAYVEDKKVRTALNTYYTNKNNEPIIDSTEKLIEINNKLLDSIIYSLRNDINSALTQDFDIPNIPKIRDKEERNKVITERFNHFPLQKFTNERDRELEVKNVLKNIIEEISSHINERNGTLYKILNIIKTYINNLAEPIVRIFNSKINDDVIL